MRVVGVVVLFAMLLTSGAGVAVQATPEASSEVAPVASMEPVALRVMTFNVWLGAVQVDFGKVVEAIRAADADVVGLQEVEGQAGRIAEALGWSYVDTRSQVISRLPLIDPPGADGRYTFVEVRPGQVVAISNVHLPSDPYGPYEIRDGAALEEVLTLERETRLPAIEQRLAVLQTLVEQGIPVFLTGDFNAPSHLDWTPAVAEVRSAVAYPVEWPVARAAADAGFRDSYREAHPDPATRPGFTWTAGYPNPTVDPDEVFDRIDLVLVAGDATTVTSELVGEAGGPDVDLGVSPWPADHRAVVSGFEVTPGPPPLLVSVAERAVTVGDDLVVHYHAPGEAGDLVAVVQAGGDAAGGALTSFAISESSVDGAVVFGTATMAPGTYEAVLVSGAGPELARIPFWVMAEGAGPMLTVTTPSVATGAPIEVSWANAPGNRWDWVAVYAAGEVDLGNYLAYLYTGATIEGAVAFQVADFGEPLPPGDYETRLMRDDGYVVMAVEPFTVTQ